MKKLDSGTNEQIFRFQVLIEKYPTLKNVKAIKVVGESTMRKINKLYQTQCGIRTVETLEMRIKHLNVLSLSFQAFWKS